MADRGAVDSLSAFMIEENRMPPTRPIDERDIDGLLARLSDRQIADLFGLPEESVAALRRQRRAKRVRPITDGESSDWNE